MKGSPERCRKAESKEQCSPAAESTGKKRKCHAKLTPTKRASKNSTPKKTCTPEKKGAVVVSSNTAWKIDLRLEAKLSAEEDSRIYAGRKIHPFFSLWKKEKKIEDGERSLLAAKRKEGVIRSGPIHVFENVQDDASPLDWSGWTFSDKITIADFAPESSNSSFMEGSVESLNFDNFPCALRPSSASNSQNAMSCPSQLSIQPDGMLQISPLNSVVLANEQSICPSKPEDAKVDLDLDLEVNENTFSGNKDIFRKSDTESSSKFLQESMRSYYHRCKGKDERSLWIHKYKPTKASEVCGNEEAVNFLRDWLHIWHERHYQCRKGSSNMDQSKTQDAADDYICSNGDYASEDIKEKDSIRNVLLITGPTGSGKSALVHACAEEQGFKVLEVNVSDCRNGTAFKQNFGLVLESHHRRFKRSLDNTESSHNKIVRLLPDPALLNGIEAEEMEDGVIELITISDDEGHSLAGTSPRLHGKSNVYTCGSVQTLILVEDVDILFPEYRRRIFAIQHISETARGPIILTSNSNNGGLPDSFARNHVSLSLPLTNELLCHMYMVCVTEEVNINPLLLKKFILSCDGDIRKTIMQLQFWFQSKKHRQDRKVKKEFGSLSLDLEACHQVIPKILPWNYPSELAELIDKEVDKSVTIMEENTCFEELVNKEQDLNERKNDLDVQCMKTHYIEPQVWRIKKSLTDWSRFVSPSSAISELSNCSGSSCQKCDSEKDPNNGHSLDTHGEVYKRHTLESMSSDCHAGPESSSMQIFRDENTQTTKLVESSPSMAIDMVQNLWRKLRIFGKGFRKDLGQHANPEQLGDIQVANLTSGLTNLISESDLLFLNHQQKQCGIMEPPMSLPDEATYFWYDHQTMMSTVAVHGFCFYAKQISDVASKLGGKNHVDLTSEMLACTPNVMALGKLSRQNQTKNTSIYAEKQLEMNSPTYDIKRTSLFKVVESIIPARSSMAIRGGTFNEYISLLRQISVSEDFRIIHGSEKKRKRRRNAPHYLSRGKMALSPEDISLVCEGDLYSKISSQYTITNKESNCT